MLRNLGEAIGKELGSLLARLHDKVDRQISLLKHNEALCEERCDQHIGVFVTDEDKILDQGEVALAEAATNPCSSKTTSRGLRRQMAKAKYEYSRAALISLAPRSICSLVRPSNDSDGGCSKTFHVRTSDCDEQQVYVQTMVIMMLFSRRNLPRWYIVEFLRMCCKVIANQPVFCSRGGDIC